MKYRYTAEEKVIVWLDSFESLTYRQKLQILSLIEDVSRLPAHFCEYKEILLKISPPAVVQELENALGDENYLPSLLSNLDRKDIFFITLRSQDYPKELLQTPAPPLVLYGKGNRNLLKQKRFALVGSRKTLAWAQSFAKEVAAKLSKHFAVVTGLAEGGDAAALQGALQAASDRANVISVLAYGFDYVYPSAHADLLRETIACGLVITEHRPNVKPEKYLFPARNRIIAGLSQGVLMVSGGEKSGAGITAAYALEYGKDVFAVPYNPGIASGVGCNALLKNGAYVVDCVEDLLSHYGIEDKKTEPMPTLSPEEERVMRVLSQEEMHIEKIAKEVAMPPYLLTGVLTELEVRGYIARLGGNRYVAVKNILQ